MLLRKMKRYRTGSAYLGDSCEQVDLRIEGEDAVAEVRSFRDLRVW